VRKCVASTERGEARCRALPASGSQQQLTILVTSVLSTTSRDGTSRLGNSVNVGQDLPYAMKGSARKERRAGERKRRAKTRVVRFVHRRFTRSRYPLSARGARTFAAVSCECRRITRKWASREGKGSSIAIRRRRGAGGRVARHDATRVDWNHGPPQLLWVPNCRRRCAAHSVENLRRPALPRNFVQCANGSSISSKDSGSVQRRGRNRLRRIWNAAREPRPEGGAKNLQDRRRLRARGQRPFRGGGSVYVR